MSHLNISIHTLPRSSFRRVYLLRDLGNISSTPGKFLKKHNQMCHEPTHVHLCGSGLVQICQEKTSVALVHSSFLLLLVRHLLLLAWHLFLVLQIVSIACQVLEPACPSGKQCPSKLPKSRRPSVDMLPNSSFR